VSACEKADNRSMADALMMTLALAVIIPLSMLIYGNSRITEAKETLRRDDCAADGGLGWFRKALGRDPLICGRRCQFVDQQSHLRVAGLEIGL
jgi:hypothetical protein